MEGLQKGWVFYITPPPPHHPHVKNSQGILKQSWNKDVTPSTQATRLPYHAPMPCTARLARQPKHKSRPHQTYMEQNYMILLLFTLMFCNKFASCSFPYPPASKASREVAFFYVGPPKEDIFSGHLLSPVFQSSYTLQLQISFVTFWR